MDLSEIKLRLAQQAESVAGHLLPRGKRVGHEWQCGSIGGENGESLKVRLTGAKAGVWADFATGDGGDLIDLWLAVRGENLPSTIREIKAWLGVVEPKFTPLPERHYRRPERPKNCVKPKEASPVFEYLIGRGISVEAIRKYEIGEQETNGRQYIVFPYKRDGELIGIKYRNIEDKTDMPVEAKCEPILFGWQAIQDDAREVLICEGEIDAPTWFDYGMPALSVPFGAGGKGKLNWIEREYQHLERFEIIYISMDMDASGQEGLPEMVDRLGRHRCRVVSLPYKDANECRAQGVDATTMLMLLANAASPDPLELKPAEAYTEDVIEEFYPSNDVPLGFKPPWGDVAKSFMFVPSEVTIWTGWSGHGKSMALSQLMVEGIAQGERACIFSGEIKPAKQLKRMVRQITGQKYPSRELIRIAMRWLSGRLWLFDLTGTAKADRLRSVFDYARRRYAVTQFVIDSLMKCGMAEDDYSAQKLFVEGWTDFANEHSGVHVHIVAHSRKKGSDREDSGRMDVKGSGGITDLAHNVIVLWRNREKEKLIGEAMRNGAMVPVEKAALPDAMLTIDKTREQEIEGDGRSHLWFHRSSLQYVDGHDHQPRRYVTEATIFEDEEVYA
jgi:twinkle protein